MVMPSGSYRLYFDLRSGGSTLTAKSAVTSFIMGATNVRGEPRRRGSAGQDGCGEGENSPGDGARKHRPGDHEQPGEIQRREGDAEGEGAVRIGFRRSEEHTSELQSRQYL